MNKKKRPIPLIEVLTELHDSMINLVREVWFSLVDLARIGVYAVTGNVRCDICDKTIKRDEMLHKRNIAKPKRTPNFINECDSCYWENKGLTQDTE